VSVAADALRRSSFTISPQPCLTLLQFHTRRGHDVVAFKPTTLVRAFQLNGTFRNADGGRTFVEMLNGALPRNAQCRNDKRSLSLQTVPLT